MRRDGGCDLYRVQQSGRFASMIAREGEQMTIATEEMRRKMWKRREWRMKVMAMLQRRILLSAEALP